MKNVIEYLKLMRLDKPVGFILLFWPCAFGLLYASKFAYVSPKLFILFLYGSVVMRAAGCIINDIFDRKIDAQVERTKARPIASKKIAVFNALILTVFLFVAGAIILFSLNLYAIYIGFCSIFLIIMYPLMKRFIDHPQLFLGITFSVGALMSFVHVTNELNLGIMLLYIGCIFWTFGYDTIYGYQDTEDDQKIGVKSSSISVSKYATKFLYACYAVFLLILLSLGIYYQSKVIYYLLLTCVMLQMLWQIATLKMKSTQSCLVRFKSNIWLGALVSLALLFL